MTPANSKDLSRLSIDRSSPPDPGRRGASPLLWLIVLLLVGYLGWERFARTDDSVEVTFARVVRTGGAQAAKGGITANGYVIARKRAAISTEIQGRLIQLEVEEGDRVNQGDLLAKLDTRQLEASAAQARADVKRQAAQVKLAELRLARAVKLGETGNSSQEDIDTANAELDSANATTESLAARVREIEIMIENSSVFAPFTGVVILKNAEIGEVVSALGAGGGGNSRGAVATVVDFETLEIQVELAQTSLAIAQVDAPVHVYLDAYPKDRYRGRVRQIWPTADRQKATVELRVALLERDDRVLPDMGCRVEFQPPETTSDEIPRIFVPARAVIPGSPAQVFVVEDGRAILKLIGVSGEEENGRLAVSNGLTGREIVVIDPPASLRDGDAVRDGSAVKE